MPSQEHIPPHAPHSSEQPRRRFRPRPSPARRRSLADREERFLLLQLMGSGGVCEVWSALDLRRVEWSDAMPRVAVKRLLPELAHNFQAQLALAQEFCILRRLAHPGVVRVFDLHREPFGLCYSMELLRGRRADEAAGLPDAPVVPVAARFFHTLSFLHAQGIAHGDIKPSNLFLEPGGRPVLIDFNVAAAIVRGDRSLPARGLRESLRLAAYNVLYSSPERLDGGPPSAADDVFSACCTVYELFSGAHPFRRRSSQEAGRQGLSPSKPAEIPALPWLALRRGLSLRIEERPSAAALRRAFAAWNAWRRCAVHARNFFTR